MNINRHNYEVFFLLYVDNELSAAERKAVEVFVLEHVDLKEEFKLMQQTVSNATGIFFENKTVLLKDEQNDLIENLLLYLDNELDAAAIIKTEQLLNTDVVAQKEFTLLQKTKLQTAPTIIFLDKKSLYRKEEGRVVGLAWWRVAAAAVLLGFGAWITVAIFNNNKVNGISEVAGINGTKKLMPSTSIIGIAGPSVQPVQQNSNSVQVNPTVANKKMSNTSTQLNNLLAQKIMTRDLQKDNDNTVAKKDNTNKPSNNLPTPDYNNFNKNNSNETGIVDVPLTDKITSQVNSGNTKAVMLPNNNATDGYALNTQFSQGNTLEQNNDGVLYMDGDDIKKSKFGGFLRKVKRLVERNTNIKTGNGIKVASFDISIK
ncbi:MAG: hypothetical protein WCG67_05805 [Ferruginibacter sp.]